MKIIYTAHSKHSYYAKHFISAYVMDKGLLPLNPFLNCDFFMETLVGREAIIKVDKQFIGMSDEFWQFGEVSHGRYKELVQAIERKIPIKFFTVGKSITDIKPITNVNDVVFEKRVAAKIDIEQFKEKLAKHILNVS